MACASVSNAPNVQEVEARTCTQTLDGNPTTAWIFRNCVATSTADLLAKAIAGVTVRGACETGYKTQYCQNQYEPCQQFATRDANWTACVDQVRYAFLPAS
jgi:roadblock/LC7 domain-containing protein